MKRSLDEIDAVQETAKSDLGREVLDPRIKHITHYKHIQKLIPASQLTFHLSKKIQQKCEN